MEANRRKSGSAAKLKAFGLTAPFHITQKDMYFVSYIILSIIFFLFFISDSFSFTIQLIYQWILIAIQDSIVSMYADDTSLSHKANNFMQLNKALTMILISWIHGFKAINYFICHKNLRNTYFILKETYHAQELG